MATLKILVVDDGIDSPHASASRRPRSRYGPEGAKQLRPQHQPLRFIQPQPDRLFQRRDRRSAGAVLKHRAEVRAVKPCARFAVRE